MDYVLGFAFNKELTRVLLIHKTKPDWQARHWNGVGGKIEFGEYPIEAMVREFKEETNIDTHGSEWVKFRLELFKGSALHMFTAKLPDEQYYKYQTMTEERVCPVYVQNLHVTHKIIPNLTYLVPMAKYWLEHSDNLPHGAFT